MKSIFYENSKSQIMTPKRISIIIKIRSSSNYILDAVLCPLIVKQNNSSWLFAQSSDILLYNAVFTNNYVQKIYFSMNVFYVPVSLLLWLETLVILWLVIISILNQGFCSATIFFLYTMLTTLSVPLIGHKAYSLTHICKQAQSLKELYSMYHCNIYIN